VTEIYITILIVIFQKPWQVDRD